MIWREKIVSAEYVEGAKMLIPKFELLKAVTPLGPGIGLVGTAIATYRLEKFKKRKDFKIVGSKEKRGTIVSLKYINENEKKEGVITLHLPENYLHFTNWFFEKHWKKVLDEKDKKSNKCYIASVCYKHEYAPEVQLLRLYRDEVLSKSGLGISLVTLYYSISPKLVKYVKENVHLSRMVKYLILDRLVRSIKKKLKEVLKYTLTDKIKKKSSIGIFAYGSLINEPGSEIEELTVSKIPTKTPFNVEFNRKSNTRCSAPTLIPVENGGNPVSAVILVLNEKVSWKEAKNILWRREINKVSSKGQYKEIESPGINTVQIKTIPNFHSIDKVIYTYIEQNIKEPVTPSVLANLAIKSILSKAGKDKRDGIRYLDSVLTNGIITNFCKPYKEEILKHSGTSTLKEAIKHYDTLRENKSK